MATKNIAKWEVTETTITADHGIYIEGQMTLQLVEFRGVENRATKIIIDFDAERNAGTLNGSATLDQQGGGAPYRIGGFVSGKMMKQAAFAKRVLAVAFAEQNASSVWHSDNCAHVVRVIDGEAFPVVAR